MGSPPTSATGARADRPGSGLLARIGLAALTVALAVGSWLPPASRAEPRPLARGISDGSVLLAGPVPAATAMRRGREAGARVVRLPLSWSTTVRHNTVPADPTNPADPDYDFSDFDALLRAASRNGMAPLVRIGGAPADFESRRRWRFAPLGTWAPDPVAYGQFAQAAARRYSGRFPDPVRPGQALPRVRFWQAWNEPNLPEFLNPQWVARDGHWQAWTPAHYRRMLNAFYAGVKAVDPTNVVATAGTAPTGDPGDGAGRMAPVRFWQELLCLGSAPRVTLEPCPDPAHFDVLVHHPLTVTDPDVAAREPLDVSIADLYKLKQLLRIAQRTGRVVPARGTRLWVTELNWDSRPPDPGGATAAQLNRWIPRALFRLWREGVDLVNWQFVRDPIARPEHPAGLYQIDRNAPLDLSRDTPKPALAAFRFPFTGQRHDERRLELWGLTPRPQPGMVALQRLHRGRWVRLRRLRTDRGGMVHAIITLRGPAELRLAAPGLGRSPAWHAPAA